MASSSTSLLGAATSWAGRTFVANVHTSEKQYWERLFPGVVFSAKPEATARCTSSDLATQGLWAMWSPIGGQEELSWAAYQERLDRIRKENDACRRAAVALQSVLKTALPDSLVEAECLSLLLLLNERLDREQSR